jgi:hypothetical protein
MITTQPAAATSPLDCRLRTRTGEIGPRQEHRGPIAPPDTSHTFEGRAAKVQARDS